MFAATSHDKRFLSPLIVGIGIWLGFPTVAAYQDMASLVSGISASECPLERLCREIGGRFRACRRDALRRRRDGTASISGAGDRRARHRRRVASAARAASPAKFPTKTGSSRAGKKGRIVRWRRSRRPKPFSAGSIFERTSLLIAPAAAGRSAMAFASPDIHGKEVEIAAAFYTRKEKRRDPGVPAVLADSSPTRRPTYWRPPTRRRSPTMPGRRRSRACCGTRIPTGGRFIPPLAKGDHAWMSEPLPPSVFSQGRAEMPRQRHLFRGARRKPAGPGRGRAGRAQPGPQPGLSQHDLRRRLPERQLAQPLPVLLRLRRRQGPHRQPRQLQDGRGDRDGGHRRQDLPSRGRLVDPLLCRPMCSPRWARTMQKMKKIGLHIFYRTYGGGWSCTLPPRGLPRARGRPRCRAVSAGRMSHSPKRVDFIR